MKTSLTRTLNRHILPVLLFGMLVTFSAILNAQPAKKAGNSVVDIIVNSANHNTLEAAVKAAGLVGTLSGDGPFTVFAPTDDAFAALPAGTIDALLADPSGALTDILLYHVIGAKVMSTDLSDGQMTETLLGKDVKVTINNDGVFINDAKVTVADIQADNGVVHVINAVLTPPSNTVADIIVNSENHNTLEAAVKAAGLVGTLSGDGPFTVFAPTDDAFAALPAGTIDALLADPSGALTDILLYHVIGAKVMSTDLSDGQMAETLLGKDVKVTINSDGVYINDAKVTVADIQADNGVVHVIDMVLVYKDETLGIFQNKTEKMKVYPNPASDYVKVHIDGSESYTVRLLSLDGKTIKRFENVGSDSNLKLSDVQNGTYMLLSEGKSSRAASKILIQR